MSALPPEPAPGVVRHKFIVDSAPEAATIIRQQLGPAARVIAVRPVPHDGLGRFFKNPRLEVIAEMPAAPSAAAAPVPAAVAPAPTAPTPEAPRFTPEPIAPSASAPISDRASNRFWNMLERAGLRRGWLEQLREGTEWQELASLPLATSLPRAAALLLRNVPVPTLPLGGRCAFFGGPGAGTTTALCKQLARDPLSRYGGVAVMKIEHSRPNAAEALATVCEALHVPLVRSMDELPDQEAVGRVYFDAPGLRLDHRHSLRTWLEEYSIESRVLVLNAAYEASLLQEYYARGEAAGATHVVFTHLDELPRWGKLWEFLLRGRLAPLFGSIGGSLSGECEPELLALLTRQTVGGAQGEV